jgi:hypothetical protein
MLLVNVLTGILHGPCQDAGGAAGSVRAIDKASE